MSTNAPPDQLSAHDPQQAGQYRLLGRLGQGGQGTVYLGEDRHGQRVAVKMLNVGVRRDVRARDRFLREVAAARQVASFCTAQILDVNVDNDPPYVVSELIEGRNLHQEVAKKGPVRGARLDRLAIGTATALTAIHQAGVVHCDFKPGNVVCGPDGARVIDFGIARAPGYLTSTTIMGSASYMSPERYRNADVGPAADIFAWAATMAFAAAGYPPFGDDDPAAVMKRVMEDPPRLSGLSAGMDELLRDCLRKDPAARPAARAVLLRLVEHSGAAVDDARLLQSVHDVVTERAPTRPAGSSTNVAPLRVTWGRSLARESRTGGGIALAAVMGAAGAGAGYLAGHAVLPAVALGGAALAVTYLVRTLVATRGR